MDENVIRRIMPHSLEAEGSVIGSMVVDPATIVTVSEMLKPDDFYNKQYSVVFETMVELHNSAKAIDLVTLKEALLKKDLPPEVSSLNFLKEIIDNLPTSANIKAYANIVAEKAVLRRLISLNEEIASNCYQGKDSLEAILDDTEKRMFALLQRKGASEFVPIERVVANALEKIEIASKNGGRVTGIPTGFLDLDYKTAGLQPSDLVLIAARPSMGKTAFALNIAQNVAIRQNKAMVIFSLEMSKESLVNRVFSMESGVDAQKLRTGNLNENDWLELFEGANKISESNLVIDDTPGISINELRSKCRKLKLEKDIQLIMIDYLQLMVGSGKTDSRQQEVSDISRSLKALARELNVPVIALSQLSREAEKRQDHRPMLSDLRESGAIEQDADVVMFLYRDDYYDHDSPDKGITEVIIAKQRNGPVGTVKLAWIAELTKFGNLEHRKQEEE